MDAGLVQTVVLVDVVDHGPRKGGVVIARGEVAGVVGVALVGARLRMCICNCLIKVRLFDGVALSLSMGRGLDRSDPLTHVDRSENLTRP